MQFASIRIKTSDFFPRAAPKICQGRPPMNAFFQPLHAASALDIRRGAGRVNVPEGGRRRHDEVFIRTVFETEHPLVHVHPETGERSLIVGPFIQRLLGLTTSDSQHLLAIFHDHATRPENTVRWI